MSRLPHLPLIPLAIVASIVVVGFLTFTTVSNFVHDYHLHNDEAEVRRDIAQLEQDHRQLVAVRDYLKSDEYIEAIARRILGLVKPGETLVVVSGTAREPTATPARGAVPTPPSEWWKSLFGDVAPAATASP